MPRWAVAMLVLLLLGTSGVALAAEDAAPPCVDVQIGADRSAYLNCLNDQLQRKVEREHAVPQPAAPITAQSPSNQVGTYNDAAAREKMGDAFGRSATPQRPERNFVNPLLPGAH